MTRFVFRLSSYRRLATGYHLPTIPRPYLMLECLSSGRCPQIYLKCFPPVALFRVTESNPQWIRRRYRGCMQFSCRSTECAVLGV